MKVNLHDNNPASLIQLQDKMFEATGKIYTLGHLTNLVLAHYFSTTIPTYEDLHNAKYKTGNNT